MSFFSRLPPSTLVQKPTVITVRLVRPLCDTDNPESASTAINQHGDPMEISVENAGPTPSLSLKANGAGANGCSGQTHQKSTTASSEHESAKIHILGTYHVHLSALTSNSDYFKALESFNGQELETKQVDIETPIDIDEVSTSAFGCFIDYIYAGSFDESRYPFLSDAGFEPREEQYVSLGHRVLGLIAIYVLADRLLVERVKLIARRKMFINFGGFQKVFSGDDDDADIVPEKLDADDWGKIKVAARILFDGTVSKCGASEAKAEEAMEEAEQEAREKEAWVGKEPMQNLLAAFLAHLWRIRTQESDRAAALKARRELAQECPELMEQIVAYLALAVPFDELPLVDFDLSF